MEMYCIIIVYTAHKLLLIIDSGLIALWKLATDDEISKNLKTFPGLQIVGKDLTVNRK